MVGSTIANRDLSAKTVHLNTIAVESMQSLLPTDDFLQIMTKYCSDIQRCIEEISELSSLMPNDAEKLDLLRATAHELKGCSGQVGAVLLQQNALEMESVCKLSLNGDFGSFYRIIQIQEFLFEEVKIVLDLMTETYGTPAFS